MAAFEKVFLLLSEREAKRGFGTGCLHYCGNLLGREHGGSAIMALSCSQVTFETACPDLEAFPAACVLQKATGLFC